MAKTPSQSDFSLGMTLDQLRDLLWREFQQMKFLVELARQMRYGEIRIQVSDGVMKDIHVDLRFREKG